MAAVLARGTGQRARVGGPLVVGSGLDPCRQPDELRFVEVVRKDVDDLDVLIVVRPRFDRDDVREDASKPQVQGSPPSARYTDCWTLESMPHR